jgi:enamine deaminase RidA (YjgF/YER057c/UK114 family)
MTFSELEKAAESTPYDRLVRLGITLPMAPAPVANFVTHVQEGKLLFLSGQGPSEADGRVYTGKVGAEVTVDQAYAHARLTGINLIAVMHAALGDLRRVRRVVKLFGMVNATPGFADIFGERGTHARSAVGHGSLPGGISVEIEAVIAID